jgi:hypothetical protein
MAHYAFLDDNNIVTEVIVGIHETELIEGKDPATWYGEFRGQRCVRTSYNGNIRKRYAGIGSIYSDDLDAFMAPQPFPSWTLDSEEVIWLPPVEYPTDGLIYHWDEENLDWVPSQFQMQGELE